MSKKIVYLLLGIILIVGLVLRNHNLTVWPREGATFDEYAWTFLGMSILEKGIPTSWSPHQAYENKVHYVNPRGASFFLVTPYLEHPPLFGLVAGGFAKLVGIRSFDDVTISAIRPLALLLGGVSIIAVFLFGTSVFGSPIGVLSAGIYAIMPTVVVGGRLLQNENFFIPFFLFTLTSAHEYTKRKRKWLLIMTYIFCFLLPLAKMPWIAVNAAIIGIFLYKKMYREAIGIVITSILSVGSFLIYGLALDAPLFINLWKLQLARYDMTYTSVFQMITNPIVTDRLFLDGWIYAGWVAIVLVLASPLKVAFPLVIGFLSYLFVYVFAIPSEPGHGWYRYPFYPFLAVALAWMLKSYGRKNYLVPALFFLLVILSMLGVTWLPAFGFSYPVYRIVIGVIGLSVLPILISTKYTERISKIMTILLCVITLLLTIWAGWGYNEQ